MNTYTGLSSSSLNYLNTGPVAGIPPAPPPGTVSLSASSVSTFNILGPQPPPPPASNHVAVGVDLGPNPGTAAINAFIQLTGRPVSIRRVKLGNQIPKTLAASAAANDLGVRKVFFDFAPDNTNTPSQLDAFLGDCQNRGLNCSVSLYAGPTGGSDGPFYIFSSPTAYYQSIKPYVPIIRKHGYKHVYVQTNYLINHLHVLPAWWPGPPAFTTGLVDTFMIRFYAGEGGHTGSQTVDTLNLAAAAADNHGQAFGLAAFEIAQDTNTEAQGDSFLNYVLSFFQARLAAGQPVADMVLTSINTSLVTHNTYDFRNPGTPASYLSLYRQIWDAFD